MPAQALPVVKGARGSVLEEDLHAGLCAAGDIRLDLRHGSRGEEGDGEDELHVGSGEVLITNRTIKKNQETMCA